MTFEEVLQQASGMLQRLGRVSYRSLKRQFDLDDEYFEELKEGLLYTHCERIEDDGCGFRWTGEPPAPTQHPQPETDSETRFQVLLRAVMWQLQCDGRVTYRTLKHMLALDDELLSDIRKELSLRQLASDEDGEVLVWTGAAQPFGQSQATTPMPTSIAEALAVGPPAAQDRRPSGMMPAPLHAELVTSPDPAHSIPEAERRQLTVMFCDLVGSTDLSGKLDPEHLREVVKAYQETAAGIIHRYEGHIAQYLGDGLLIYFGFPVAHEDDAQRAVLSGLGIPEALATLNRRLEKEYGVQLAVRIGIHTGPVVVGEMGGGGRHENLALGETPNIAARLEGLAPANTAVISPMTAQLVQRSFVLEELGRHDLKGVAEPMMLYTVVRPREAGHDDHHAMMTGGFETLVGRGEEIGLLLRRWEQSKEGLGQVVLLSGEAGIGKSSLVEGLRAHVRQEGLTRIAFRCSPYHTNSAFYPIIEHVQRALGWQPEDTIDTQLAKLEQGLGGTSLPLEEAVPLLASLLSLALPEGRYPALSMGPEQQRQQTQDVLVAWMLEEAERQPVLAVWEDLHWADPSTLENLGLLVEQAPTATMLHVLTFRPEFEPPWPTRSHLTPITLNRLERPQVEALVSRLAGGKRLPEEVVAHIVGKTDGVPLYVEELTKMLLTSELLREEADQYVLTGPLLSLAIPDTLQDSLMARLDQMKTAKEVVQLGSVLGREFAYEMLQALSWQDEETLQSALAQLVQAELLYQRGRPPRARYLFKHALIQDAAYGSLLRSTRRGYHQQMAQLLEARFPEVVETQPEVVAHHYTEAACPDQAIGYWQRAGERAIERSANLEAISHLTKGLEVLKTLPDTPERLQQEIILQTTLGRALIATKGQAAPEVEQAYTRARELCHQLGDEPLQLFPVLFGLWNFYVNRGELKTAHELGEHLLSPAQRVQDPALLLQAHRVLGVTLYILGEFVPARAHLEQCITLYNPQKHRSLGFLYGFDPGMVGESYVAHVLWYLGYPDQALKRSHDAFTLGREVPDPLSLALALGFAAILHQLRREGPAAQAQAEACVTLSTEQGFPHWLAWGTTLRGWGLAEQREVEEGMAQMRQGLAAYRATGAEVWRPYYLALLAEAHGKLGQAEAGLSVLAEGLSAVQKRGGSLYESEMYRLKGELLKQQAEMEAEAATCFHQAINIARRQQAKSLELRAATSLARLWQFQDKRQDAYDLLTPVYEWFTEGFDTADLKDAKTLIDELSEGR